MLAFSGRMTMSINYVVACWSGMRRINPKLYLEDRSVFLRIHLESLQRLKHSLSQVTFVFADNPEEPEEYKEFRTALPDRIGSAKVVSIQRPNVGYSYGAYNDVFDKYRSDFDHYLLMEDDYVYTQDQFDQELLRSLEEDPRCGLVSFVCDKGTREWITGRARREAPGGRAVADSIDRYLPETFVFPRIMVGLARSKALDAIWKEFGRLPFSQGVNHTGCKFEGQFSLAVVFQKLGWTVADMLPRWRAEAFGPAGERLMYGPPDRPLFVKPIQFEL